MRSLFIMAGPDVKKNYRMKRTMWAVDIAPTIAYILDLPVPQNTEGSVLYEALEDPNAAYKHRQQILKKNVGSKWHTNTKKVSFTKNTSYLSLNISLEQ